MYSLKTEMKKRILKILAITFSIYVLICGALYFFQEKLIFFPQKLEKNYQFNFGQEFEEMNIRAEDGKLLNGLLFKASASKGLIFYLHGNAGSLSTWGSVAKTYTDLNYDIFILDYRSYGKSEGTINSENQLFEDNQTAYNELKQKYSESQIIVIGYSIGSGLAAKIASTNSPKLLILQAPYYNLTDMMKKRLPILPTAILKYKFATNEYLKNCKMPVIIFHGDQDKVIYYGSSIKLQNEFKPQDTLITLPDQGHNGITDNEIYKSELTKILAK